MKVIYEPGDIVYNSNNYTYAIVLGEYDDNTKILEVGQNVFVNNPPKAALAYIGHTDIKKAIKAIVDPFAEVHKKIT